MCGTVLEVYVSREIEIVPKDGFWLLLYYLIFHIENFSNIWTVSKNFEKYSPILFFEFFQNFEKYYFIQRFLNSIFNSWVIRYVSELFVPWNFFFFRRKDSAKVEFIALVSRSHNSGNRHFAFNARISEKKCANFSKKYYRIHSFAWNFIQKKKKHPLTFTSLKLLRNNSRIKNETVVS